MPTDCISYQNSGYFSKLIVDYLDQKTETQSLYHRFPTLENFKLQIEEKRENFSQKTRTVLVNELKNQYSGFSTSDVTVKNIELLENENTFTITTGHQLNLFTGPLYFIYKIVSVINLCKQLKSAYPDFNFVPVYWMATEDHDFEEINYFYFKNKKIHWNKESFGPVGRLSTNGLEEVFEVFSKELGLGNNAESLRNLFRKAYLEHSNLADATRYLANELFKEEGLVILDGDCSSLKKLFSPYIKTELQQQLSHKQVSQTISKFGDYAVQVNPREINLFYIEDKLRERILFENGIFKINNASLHFSENELLEQLEKHPEKFSPNVILRPLYQEVILPNLCYIGGGGELAYWLELKSNFETNQVTFPVLLLRNSVLLASEKQNLKADKLGLNWSDLFSKQSELITQRTKAFSEFNLDFSQQKEFLKNQFENLTQIAQKTDVSFIGAVKAQEKKQLKGLENLEKRLLKAEKRNHAEKLERIIEIQNELFPNQSLQERKANFSEFFLECGNSLIKELLNQLNPLSSEFNIITLK
ncbi:bacillithiol biosynthesis cysteine-adding enzyme BshC [Flavobacterium sp. SM15]|uniref:bacillithiol biosynthesis cysteine-adding enzyme BshC n=1 Tax=Flavobacterium sp. SM15 TaxID=2908005 RepID=UPI001EDB3588|nr:bacillithiol biosynthesis cysteine-adding enzyme BshC [Flavobacterium sp. SM15]MCG2611085.1 bacillithiol biosynthesis cysteine-adding enzyme BshC [Flavobacterium sp. SM15]